MSKYNSRKTKIDGITFDSKREANRYLELKLLQRAGKIKDLQLQVPYELTPAYTNKSGKKIRASRYYADFVYIENGEQVIEDVKGVKTDLYKLKKKILETKYGLEIKEV